MNDMTTDDWVDGWIKGFVEAQGSFSLNIGLQKSKNQKWIVFKPYIGIANVDSQQLSFIRDYFGLSSSISPKKKKHSYESRVYSLSIQRLDEIELFIHIFSKHKFKSSFKQSSFDGFVEGVILLKKVGFVHKIWSDEFNDVLDVKYKINNHRGNINKKRISKGEWAKKIKEHLE